MVGEESSMEIMAPNLSMWLRLEPHNLGHPSLNLEHILSDVVFVTPLKPFKKFVNVKLQAAAGQQQHYVI